MNKNEFIKELSTRLKYIPAEDREDAISYYTEYIEDMNLSEDEDVTKNIGQPKDVAKAILSDVKDKHISQQKESKSAKGTAMVVWLVILGLLSAPLSIPIGIVALALAFALVVTVAAIILSLFAAAAALLFGGIVALLAVFSVGSFGQGLFCFGIGLLTIGLGLALGLGMVKLVMLICKDLGGKKAVRIKDVEK